jgi:hypothetical protein
MATRVCPTCNAQYVASVRRCIDCDVMLVDQVGVEASSSATVETSSGEQVVYELEGWGNQLRQSLAGMLDLAGIPFVWEAGSLVVPASFEDEVDDCIAAVEGGDADDLPEDAPLVAFDIEGATPEELDELDATLIAQHIAHSWEDGTGALLVPVEREDEVAALIEGVLDHEVDPDDADDGLAVHAALDRLYVAVDKLVKDISDDKLAGRYLDAAAGVEHLGIPYGLSGAEWRAFVLLVSELDAAIREVHPQFDGDDAEDDVDVEVDAEVAEVAEVDGEADEDVVEVDEDEGDAEADADEDEDEDAVASTPGAVAEARARALRDRLRELV